MSRLKDGECAWEEDIERERERRTRAGSGREEKNTRGLTGRKGWGVGRRGGRLMTRDLRRKTGRQPNHSYLWRERSKGYSAAVDVSTQFIFKPVSALRPLQAA